MALGLTSAAGGETRSAGLTRAGGVAAILWAALLLIGLVGLVAPSPSLVAPSPGLVVPSPGLAVPLPGLGLRNWLVVLFEISAGIGALPAEPLRLFNPLDIVALLLVGGTFLGLRPALGRAHRVWIAVAAALPFVGIVVLLATGLAGRSAVMGAGLIVAVLMLKNRVFRPLAYLGILANVLLLIGDVATGTSRAPVVAALVGLGYLLLMVWFLAIGAWLLGWGRRGGRP
jgi:hypothetical protein